jgi:Bifunctional DNA primase/polymerase, N-terminal
MSPLECALELASQGFKVFFCALDKTPTTPHGFCDATDDPGALFDLWQLNPGGLIGVATGEVSSFDVVDVDVEHLSARLWWHLKAGHLPQTTTHATRRGGVHLLFRHQTGMCCSASRIAIGVDVRGDGGYCIWWPAAGLPVLCDKPPAPWPEWLAALAEPRASIVLLQKKAAMGRRSARGSSNSYGNAALRRAIDRILNAPRGLQERVINREAFSLGTLIGAKVISKEDAYRDLLEIANRVPSLNPSRPWRPGEVGKKIERGLAEGILRPRPGIRS